EFRQGAVWEPVAKAEQFDIVISNPPYIAPQERAELQPEVRDWEPAGALFAEDDGLAVIRSIVSGAHHHLAGGGLLALEVGMTQAQRVAEEISAADFYEQVQVVRDLAGRDRIITAVRKVEA